MSAHERVYRLLLRAYPATFRADFERQMLLAFRDMRRESRGDWPALWAALLWDLARSAPALRAAEVRARWTCDIQLEEGTMRPMAILMVLVGAVELGNAAFEGWAGGIARGEGISLLGGSMGTVAGLVLMIAAHDYLNGETIRMDGALRMGPRLRVPADGPRPSRPAGAGRG